MLFRLSCLVGLVFALCSCQSAPTSANLNYLYDDLAKVESPDRNPVIVIPGLVGSKLIDSESGLSLWGSFEPGAANPKKPEHARLMAIPMKAGAPLAQLQDGVVPNGALDRFSISLLPGIRIQSEAYENILRALGAGGYRDSDLGKSGAVNYGDDHYTCFQFAYDWRRSNAENAARLNDFIEEQKAYVEAKNRERFGRSGDVKFDIVAHSMGGLLTRYFLRYGDQPLPRNGLPSLTWAGARNVEKVILISTPNAGSIQSLREMNGGIQFSPILPEYRPFLLGTFPSLYELLPRTRHKVFLDENEQPIDGLSLATWERYEWGLLQSWNDAELQTLLPEVTSSSERREIARDHVSKCLANAREFHAALDKPATPPKGVELYTFVGDAIQTTTTGKAHTGGIEITEWWPGDGTVARYSALMKESFAQRKEGVQKLRTPIPWTQTYFLPVDHLGITKDGTFNDNILFLLLEK